MVLVSVDRSFLRDQKLRGTVERALERVKKLRAEGKTWEHFEVHDIGAPWWEVRELVYDYGVFKIACKSRTLPRIS